MSVTAAALRQTPARAGGVGPWMPARRDRCRLFDVELAAFAPPVQIEPSEVRCVDHDAQEAILAERDRAGRTSSAIWWLAPRSIVWTLRRAAKEIAEIESDGHTCSRAGLPGRSVLELRRQRPFTCHHVVARISFSTRNPRAGLGIPRSISRRPRISNVSQSMMNTPGGPSVPSLPPPPSVLT